MKVSRTDLVPVLTIMAGGAIGVFLTLSPRGPWSPSDSAPGVRYVPVQNAQSRVFVTRTGDVFRFRAADGDRSPLEVSPDGRWVAYRAQPLIYIDGVRVGTSFPEGLDPNDIASIESVKGDAAIESYGEEAYLGVYLISLKEAGRRR